MGGRCELVGSGRRLALLETWRYLSEGLSASPDDLGYGGGAPHIDHGLCVSHAKFSRVLVVLARPRLSLLTAFQNG